MIQASDFIKDWNVISAYQYNKFLCFEIFTKRNDFGSVFTIKLDPNKTPVREA